MPSQCDKKTCPQVALNLQDTLPETNSDFAPENKTTLPRKLKFQPLQPLAFAVGFREVMFNMLIFDEISGSQSIWLYNIYWNVILACVLYFLPFLMWSKKTSCRNCSKRNVVKSKLQVDEVEDLSHQRGSEDSSIHIHQLILQLGLKVSSPSRSMGLNFVGLRLAWMYGECR